MCLLSASVDPNGLERCGAYRTRSGRLGGNRLYIASCLALNNKCGSLKTMINNKGLAFSNLGPKAVQMQPTCSPSRCCSLHPTAPRRARQRNICCGHGQFSCDSISAGVRMPQPQKQSRLEQISTEVQLKTGLLSRAVEQPLSKVLHSGGAPNPAL